MNCTRVLIDGFIERRETGIVDVHVYRHCGLPLNDDGSCPAQRDHDPLADSEWTRARDLAAMAANAALYRGRLREQRGGYPYPDDPGQTHWAGCLEIVTANVGVTLEEYVRQRSNVLPTHTPSGGLGHRQCTGQFKLRPIKALARAEGARHLTNLIGISTDEIQRVKPAREKWVTNEYPLVDMNLSRRDCLRIVQEAGLPRPPKSSCYFCPLQRRAQWQRLAADYPELFTRAVDLEGVIAARGGGHLAHVRYPLTAIAQIEQATLGEDFGREAEECEGGCFL